MIHPIDPMTLVWTRAFAVSMGLFLGVTALITGIDDQNTHRKELFYSWLLVLVNAYIGIFIANKAIKQQFGGFFVWGFLLNGIRAAVFLFVLLAIVEWQCVEVTRFVLMSKFGYMAFIAAEIYGVHVFTLRSAQLEAGE
ncbi:hypothetical protein [Pontiella agarivorans]|uniref:ATP synthase subunit I n=1 Tax=Pontiella agarivorans TaxID=3038953 RepID=A0ABU5MWP6_9BACT|nr:hypothetical protein [Pontiella agarivorans]MDZ8118632.1 hypothetical protein [Pontiella agarivorans]